MINLFVQLNKIRNKIFKSVKAHCENDKHTYDL